MAVAPTGFLSVPLDLLRETVAGSATFQAWTGSADQASAKLRVHAPYAAPEATHPLAAVDWGQDYERRRNATGTHNHFAATGSLQLSFRESITEADDADAAYAFRNKVGAILDEMAALAGQAGYLDVEAFVLVEPAWRPEEDEKETVGDFYEDLWRVEFKSL